MINNAKIPKGCAAKEACKFPWNIKLIEWPNPHPGQKERPRNLKKQKEKCASVEGSINASIINDVIQNTSSKYRFNNSFTAFYFFTR